MDVPVNLQAFAIRLKRCTGACGQEKPADEDHYWADGKSPDGLASRCIDCTKESRRARAEARRDGRPLPTVTEERRQELSERAHRLHQQGLLGGSAYGALGGRPRERKIRIVDAVVDHFRKDTMTDLVIRAYESNLRSNNKSNRLRAAEAIVSMESRDEELKAKLRGAGKRPEDMDPDELQEFLEQALVGMLERGELDTTGIVIDGKAINVAMPSSGGLQPMREELSRHAQADRVASR